MQYIYIYIDILIECNDVDARFRKTSSNNLILYCKKAMILGQKMTI